MSSRFWNFFANRYSRQPIGNPAAYETKLSMTAAHLAPDMRLLEIGCGTGSTALVHAPRVASIDAVDFSHRMIAIAQEKADAQGIRNVTFRVAALSDLKAPQTPYDMALALSVLHLVADVPDALRRLSAQIRPGGLLVSSTVCLAEMNGLLPRLLPYIGMTGLLPKVTPLTETALADVHTGAGFEIIERFRPDGGDSVFFIARKTA